MRENAQLISMGAPCIDCDNAGGLADFYAELLGWNKVWEKGGWAAVSSPDGVYTIGFQAVENYVPPVWPWEDGKQAQMMHMDFTVGDLAAAVRHALNCGASVAGVQYFDTAKTMIDPAGHPFCLCPKT